MMIPFPSAVAVAVAAPSPRVRILRAAERLFAERGVGEVSLQAVATAAGVERAEFGWHFADMDDLATEVLRSAARRSALVRLEALRRLEGEADRTGRPLALRAVIESFCLPFFDPETGPLLALLTIAHQAAPTPWSNAVVRDELDEIARLYIAALECAAPHLSSETLAWRYHFMLSNALHVAMGRELPQRMARLGFCHSPGFAPSRMREELIDFLVAGFDAEDRAAQAAG